MEPMRPESSRPRVGGGNSNLTYHGGSVETTPAIILDLWGPQWTGDSSGYANYLEQFLSGVGTSSDTWSTSTSQYCSGSGFGLPASSCSTSSLARPVGRLPAKVTVVTDTSSVPTAPSQSQLAAEAAAAASMAGVGVTSSTQVVVATPSGHNTNGFGTQFCAWHSSTSYAGAALSYTNLPYITDAGPTCGQNFVNSGTAGTFDGLSIVEGHELAETMTDPAPNSGWLDGSGKENGDKCAWLAPGTAGGAANLTLSGQAFAVQALWSDTFNSNAGGCVIRTTASGQFQ